MFWLIPVVGIAVYALYEEATTQQNRAQKEYRKTERKIAQHRQALIHHVSDAQYRYQLAELQARRAVALQAASEVASMLNDLENSTQALKRALIAVERQLSAKQRDAQSVLNTFPQKQTAGQEIALLAECRLSLLSQIEELSRKKDDLHKQAKRLNQQIGELNEARRLLAHPDPYPG
jgi:chromosome segregation ATPase